MLDPLTTVLRSRPSILQTPSGPNAIAPSHKRAWYTNTLWRSLKCHIPCRGRRHFLWNRHQTRHWPWNSIVAVLRQTSQQPIHLDPHSTQLTIGIICVDLHDNVLHIGEDEKHPTGGLADPILIDSQDPDDMITNIVVGDAKNQSTYHRSDYRSLGLRQKHMTSMLTWQGRPTSIQHSKINYLQTWNTHKGSKFSWFLGGLPRWIYPQH